MSDLRQITKENNKPPINAYLEEVTLERTLKWQQDNHTLTLQPGGSNGGVIELPNPKVNGSTHELLASNFHEVVVQGIIGGDVTLNSRYGTIICAEALTGGQINQFVLNNNRLNSMCIANIYSEENVDDISLISFSHFTFSPGQEIFRIVNSNEANMISPLVINFIAL